MPFEVFNKKSAGRSKSPTMTVQKRGTFSLNSASAHLLAEEPDQLAVELLYDVENRIIGIRKAEQSVNPYVLRKQPSSESYLVAGRAFAEHYGIDTSVARRYRAKLHEGEVLGITLTDDFIEVGRGSGRDE